MQHEILAIGGGVYTHTERELTTYHARVLKDHTAQAVDILGDVVLNSKYDEKIFHEQRQSILKEVCFLLFFGFVCLFLNDII